MRYANILHLTTHLGGGVGKVVLNYLKKSKNHSKFIHSIASLDYINEQAKEILNDIGVDYKDKLYLDFFGLIQTIKKYDIVLIHWWNHPLMYEFLVKYSLPKSRIIFWSHISGLYEPSNFTEPLFDYADKFVFTTPISFNTKIVQNLSDTKKAKLDFIWSSGGFEHIRNIKYKKHTNFNVGYLGTVDYSKLHKDFLEISNSIDINNIKFIVCGGNDEIRIKEESKKNGIEKKFYFVGKVDNIIKYLSLFDVFGYPLSPYHFGTCDQALAEAMACGIVPVVFNNPMESYMVEHNKTGLVVNNHQEYKEAIEKLYNNKEFRCALSRNAKKEAFKRFSLNKMVKEWEKVFDECMLVEKTTKEWNGKYKGINTTYFQIFIESTGKFGNLFENILLSQDLESTNKAEKKLKKIMSSTNTWKSKSKGTLNHYLDFFEDDNLKKLKNIID